MIGVREQLRATL